jgi:hypothetical protein
MLNLAAARGTFSKFQEFYLTGWRISCSQDGLSTYKRKCPGVLRAAHGANGNVEHEIISGGGFWGGQPQAGGI